MPASAHHQLLMSGGSGRVYQTETTTWESSIVGRGGSVTTQEKDWADDLVIAMKATGYYADILLLYPFIGTSTATHITPLIDTIGAGNLNNLGAGFVNADCTNMGLDNSSNASKFMSTSVTPQSVNGGSFGMGYWGRNMTIGTTYVEPMGCYDQTGGGSIRGVIDLRTTLQAFRMGANGNSASVASSASNGHYFGERASSTSRTLYKDGSSIATNTTSDAGFDPSSTRVIHILCCQYHDGSRITFPDRCAVAYLTKPLGGTNASNFHSLLNTWLITPTGR